MRRTRRSAAWVLAGLLVLPAAGYAFPGGDDERSRGKAGEDVRLVDDDEGGEREHRRDREYRPFRAPFRDFYRDDRYERRYRDRGRDRHDEDSWRYDDVVVYGSLNWGKAPGR